MGIGADFLMLDRAPVLADRGTALFTRILLTASNRVFIAPGLAF